MPDLYAPFAQVPFSETALEDWPAWLALAALLALSALSSGYETALLGLPETNDVARRGGRIARLFLRNRARLQAAIFVANAVSNLAFILLASALLDDFFIFEQLPYWPGFLLQCFLITTALLMFGEVAPKLLAARRPVGVFTRLAWLALPVYLALLPFAWLLAALSGWLNQRFWLRRPEFSEKELSHAIDLTLKSVAPPEERQALKSLVNLGSVQVKMIMRARVNVRMLNYNWNDAETLAFMRNCPYARLPVFETQEDKVVGVVYTKDLLELLENKASETRAVWRRHVRPPFFVPEWKRVNHLIEDFHRRREHIAIVVDEFGGAAGVVTVDDVMDEVFGDFHQLSERQTLAYEKISDTEYLFDARMPLIDACRIMDLNFDAFDEFRGDAESLNGLLLEALGEFPQAGAQITLGDYFFRINNVGDKRVGQVYLRLLDKRDGT